MSITLHSFNSWSGSDDNFHLFVSVLKKKSSYIGFQEVHRRLNAQLPLRLMPYDPGARLNPIRTNLCHELTENFQPDWRTQFAAHIDGCHDLEPCDGLQYGLFSAVNELVFDVVAAKCEFIYGHLNQFNTEKCGGVPCGKVAIGHILKHKQTGELLIVVNVHGFWSSLGKVDMPERYVQNQGINALLCRLREVTNEDDPKVLLIGDLNYTSQMGALYDLAKQSGFGAGGGVILNHQYQVKETRTRWYTKTEREADYAIVSQSLAAKVKDFQVMLDVPSDHGLLEIILKL